MSTTAQPQTTSAQNHQTIDSPDLESAQDRAAVIHNEQSVKQNAHIAMPFPGDQTPNSLATFKSTIAAPSPPPNATSTTSSSNLFHLDTSARQLSLDSTSNPSPLSGGLRLNSADLRIQTDIIPAYTVTAASSTVQTAISESAESSSRPIARPGGLTRAPSVKNVFASSIGSNSNSVFGSAPNSALSSPMLSAMADVTPLPSPLLSGDSPGPWKKLGAPLGSRPSSRDAMITADSALVAANGESISSAIANQSKRRAYHGLMQGEGTSGLNNMQALQEKNKEGHTRNRSLSEYVPGSVQIPKRHITVSGSHGAIEDPSVSMEGTMRREPHLAVQRGLAPMPRPPTPPKSTTGGESSDSDSSLSTPNGPRAHRKPRYEYYDAHTRNDSKRRRWRALKCLGTGTFSKVMLATSQSPEEIDRIDEDDVFGPQVPVEAKIDRKKLVAIKICEHGPKGGASEERIEMSLKRELEILKTTRHPSLIHLKAWNIEETRAILVVDYCPGGDLFEVASKHNELLVPALIRRIFAELVGAVRYLHERHIVHRDIKLENVLVNLPPSELAKPTDWTTYPYSVTTLTDLGLARRVADDEMLTTRCGSDDYAAPEVIMGQPYDGRSTDAWCLGVLLYALLESRLPFDPLPGAPEYLKQRSKTTHRIARVEWKWVQFAGEEGDHEGDPKKFESMGLKGAMEITEGFLNRKRSRWPMEKAAEQEWVKGAINVDGGVRYREEHVPDEVP